MNRLLLILLAAGLGACSSTATVPVSAPQSGQVGRALRDFQQVVPRVEPVAEQVCRERSRGRNCDFLILVDDRPGQDPNAYQTVDRRGRPIVVFTLPFISETRNPHELAFVFGHEAAHHIAGHQEATIASAQYGAVLVGSLAQAQGYVGEDLEAAAAFGAELGALRFSKQFELEADALGTVIAARAGYDPLIGAAFFSRIPDPGDRFFGSHPPNAQRQSIVRRVALEMTP